MSYFRVIDNIQQNGVPPDETTFRRWKRGEYYSTNESAPAEWVTASAAGHRSGQHFPRRNSTGYSTSKAKKLFLHLAKTKGLHGPHMEAVDRRLGEQDGVHCWRTLGEALKYMHGVIDGNYIVEFEGEEIEDARTAENGVIVRNVVPSGEPIPAIEFKGHEDFPEEDLQADFSDSAEYED